MSYDKSDLALFSVTYIAGLKDRLEAAERERDTLAAHVERLSSAADAVCNRDLIRPEIRELDRVLADTPETSLARLKAKWQAEAFDALVELRSQAKWGE